MKNFFTILLFILCHCLYGQKKPTDNISFAGKFEISPVKEHSALSSTIPFKDIIVRDYRFDSSKIGYLETGGIKSDYSKIILATDWTTSLNNYFSENLDRTSNLSLMIVIRDYWMQDGTYSEALGEESMDKMTGENWKIGGTTFCGIDVYAKTDSLIPLFQVNHNFLWGEKIKPGNIKSSFYLPFDSVARRIVNTDIQSLVQKRSRKSIDGLAQHYHHKKQLPILAQNNWQKGIYYSFDDFRNNKLFVTDLRLQTDKYTDDLYIIKDKEQELVMDYWGFSDGHDLFIKCGFNVYKAVRQQHSFEVFGSKQLTTHTSNKSNKVANFILFGANPPKSSTLLFHNKILQLNMDTGKFY